MRRYANVTISAYALSTGELSVNILSSQVLRLVIDGTAQSADDAQNLNRLNYRKGWEKILIEDRNQILLALRTIVEFNNIAR